MGWTSYHATHYTSRGNVNRKAECDAYFMEGLNAGHFKVLKSTMVGSVYYAAVRGELTAETDANGDKIYVPLPDEEKRVFGVVFLTSVTTKDYYNFAYKEISEDMGPAECDCPNSILDLLSETDSEWANEWRKRCREKTAKKKFLSKLPIGSEIKVKLSDEEAIFKKETIYGKNTWVDWKYRRKISEKMILHFGYEYKVCSCDACDHLVYDQNEYFAYCEKDRDITVSCEHVPESCPCAGFIKPSTLGDVTTKTVRYTA